MPETRDNDETREPDEDEFKRVISRFVRALRILLSRHRGEPPEFRALRAAVLEALESTRTIDETSRALADLHAQRNGAEASHLLVMELEAFSASVEPEETPAGASVPASWWKRLLGTGKTAIDSLREILEKYLGDRGKAIWKLASELVDIVRGD